MFRKYNEHKYLDSKIRNVKYTKGTAFLSSYLSLVSRSHGRTDILYLEFYSLYFTFGFEDLSRPRQLSHDSS